MKPIVILSSNFHQTLQWALSRYEGITAANISQRWLKDKNGQEYYIIDRPEQIYGFEISGYVKAPDFQSLEDIVKLRIR